MQQSQLSSTSFSKP